MRRFKVTFAIICGLAFLSSHNLPLSGQDASPDGYRLPQPGIVNVIDDPVLAAGVPGLLTMVAKEGDLVTADVVIAQLDERESNMKLHVARLELNVANKRANNPVQIVYATKKAEVDRANYQVALEAVKSVAKAVSKIEIKQRKLQYEASLLSITNSENDMAIAKLEEEVAQGRVDAAEMELGRHMVSAQLDGTVSQVFHQVGEWVNAGEPILRLRKLDRLYVEGYVDTDQYSPNEVRGQSCTVLVEMARGQIERFDSRIVFVDDNIEATNEFRIRAEIENRKKGTGFVVVPGQQAEVIIHFSP